jgi:hypothetical protein
MKLNKEKQINFDSTMALEGQDAKISADDMHKLWDLLQNPYKNPIGAIVREYVSNSFDAHAEAEFIKNNDMTSIRNEYSIYNDVSDADILELKKHLEVYDNDAVHVKIAKDQSGWYWSTEDFGVGLSPSRVTDVFCSYLKSTKEDTNNVIGAFGIGSKSGLSYTDIVYIRTRYNGTEYQYFLRRGEKVPRLDKLSECNTTERNGTQIKIYIKESRDRYGTMRLEDNRFREECEKQLAYFDNVYFDGCNLDNDYRILRGENWLYNTANHPFSGLHMCLGKVAYPIDWDILGAEKIHFHAALKFEIGELDIIQTREDVKYTPRTKKAILDKIDLLKEEWSRRWEEDKDLETDDFLYYYKNKDIEPYIEYDDCNFNLSELYGHYNDNWKSHLKQFTFTPFVEAGIKIPRNPFFDYESTKYIKETGLRQHSMSVEYLLKETRFSDSLYRIKETHDSRKSKYIRNVLENKDVYLIRKKSKYFYRLRNYVKYLGLQWDDRENWRTKIKLYQDTVLKSFLANTKSYDRVVLDKQWIKDNYGARKIIDRTKIIGKQLFDNYKQGSEYTYERVELIKCKIDECKAPLKIVGSHDDRWDIAKIAQIYHNSTSARLPKNVSDMRGYIIAYTVAPTNLKYFNDVDNVITMDKFKNGNNRLFTKVMTIKKLQQEEEYEEIIKLVDRLDYCSSEWAKVYKPIAEDLKYIQAFRKQYTQRTRWSDGMDNFLSDCYEIAKENDWFDYQFLDVLKRIETYFDGLNMLKHLDYRGFKGDNFPYLDIAKYIRDYNKALRNVKQFKRLNAYYYVMFNEQEVEWLKDNPTEYEFVKKRQDVKLKKVS